MNRPPSKKSQEALANELRVDDAGEGQRLDRWLSEQPGDLSRSRWRKLIDGELVTVNGDCRPARHRLRAGDVVRFTIPPVEEVDLTPDPTVPFDIVFEDDDLAVIEKPAGVVVHPGAGRRLGTLVHGLLARLNTLSEVGGRARPGIVHRLDADTSGLLVVAKTDQAYQGLQDQLRDRSLGRIYVALTWGAPREESGVIDAPLDRDAKDRRRRSVSEGGREARTHYQLGEVRCGIARLELRLETGRTHQIRAHLAHVGHPVLADELYFGDRRRIGGISPPLRPRVLRALAALNRQALHALSLHFVHPVSGQRMEFNAPWPPDMEEAWRRLDRPPSAAE
jgi:23S rRNA pseudouridine1911/1915/1917 synthase